MLDGIIADSEEDRKLGFAGQGTTIVCLGQDAASCCYNTSSRGYPLQHATTSATILTSHSQSDTWGEGTPFSQTLHFKVEPNRNDANMQLLT